MNALTVAKAIAEVCPPAGQTHGASPQSVTVRAANLVADSPHGPYVEDGDPNGWGESADGSIIVTIYMEAKGHVGDCEVPLDYYEDGFVFAQAASDLLKTHYIEFVNAAVAVVLEI